MKCRSPSGRSPSYGPSAQRPQNGDAGGGLADLRRVPSMRYTGALAICPTGVRHREFPNVQRLATLPTYTPEIAYAPEVPHFRRRVADQFTNHSGIRKHPVLVPWNKSALGNAANSPPSRFTVPRRREEGVARGDRHHTAGRCLHRDRGCVARQFEGADITLAAAFCSESDPPERRYAPKCGGTFNIAGKTSASHLLWRVRLRVADTPLGGGGGGFW